MALNIRNKLLQVLHCLLKTSILIVVKHFERRVVSMMHASHAVRKSYRVSISALRSSGLPPI